MLLLLSVGILLVEVIFCWFLIFTYTTEDKLYKLNLFLKLIIFMINLYIFLSHSFGVTFFERSQYKINMKMSIFFFFCFFSLILIYINIQQMIS